METSDTLVLSKYFLDNLNLVAELSSKSCGDDSDDIMDKLSEDMGQDELLGFNNEEKLFSRKYLSRITGIYLENLKDLQLDAKDVFHGFSDIDVLNSDKIHEKWVEIFQSICCKICKSSIKLNHEPEIKMSTKSTAKSKQSRKIHQKKTTRKNRSKRASKEENLNDAKVTSRRELSEYSSKYFKSIASKVKTKGDISENNNESKYFEKNECKLDRNNTSPINNDITYEHVQKSDIVKELKTEIKDDFEFTYSNRAHNTNNTESNTHIKDIKIEDDKDDIAFKLKTEYKTEETETDELDPDYETQYFELVENKKQLIIKKEQTVAMWIPPRSPHNLIEEVLYHDPWALLVATIFLNRTACMVARPFVFWFLTENPDPYQVVDKYPKDLEKFFVKLGLVRTRAVQVWRMSNEYLNKEWTNPSELYGIGDYGDCAYKMFVLGDFSVQPKDRFLKIYKAWYEKIAQKHK